MSGVQDGWRRFLFTRTSELVARHERVAFNSIDCRFGHQQMHTHNYEQRCVCGIQSGFAPLWLFFFILRQSHIPCSLCLPARVITANISSLTAKSFFFRCLVRGSFWTVFLWSSKMIFFFPDPLWQTASYFEAYFTLLLFILKQTQHFSCWILLLLLNLFQPEFLLWGNETKITQGPVWGVGRGCKIKTYL